MPNQKHRNVKDSDKQDSLRDKDMNLDKSMTTKTGSTRESNLKRDREQSSQSNDRSKSK